MKSLYIHIPFCHKVCTYCDFYKMVAKDSWKEKYITYLFKEFKYREGLFSDIKTIYIGGGTPSSLKLTLLEDLFQEINKYIDISSIEEFTFEMNPEDVNEEILKILSKYGVNRISLGVQSLKVKKLKLLGRNHTKKTVKNSVKLIKKYGINNINFDFIYGVNTDKFRHVKSDLRKAIRYKATHISTYSLIIEEKTIINKLINDKKYIPLSEDKDAILYKKICKYLTKKGFIHYEVSNFAKEGFQSTHNLTYWNNENYLGLGAGASYYINNVRYTNVMNLEKYYSGLDNNDLILLEKSELLPEEIMAEEMILGLRKLEGVNIAHFEEKFGKTVFEQFPFLNDKIKFKMLVLENNYLKLPPENMYLLNEVLIDFV